MIALDQTAQAPSTRLRCLQIGITASETGGGGERYYFNLMRALPAVGIDAAGLVSGDAALLTGQTGTASFAPEQTGLLKRWAGLRREVGSAMPRTDLVVSHFAPYAFPVIDQIRTRPLVVHFHGSWALEGAYEGGGRAAVAVKRLIERLVYSRGSRFIVLSRASGAILEREYGISNDAIRLIPGGVDVQRFRDERTRRAAREALGWPPDRPTVIAVRRLVRSKGLEALIDAINDVRRIVPDVLLMIAGTGPLKEELARRVKDYGLERCVRFIGQLADDLPAAYRAADLSVVPSLALEGFGLVVIEALACGTPTLVTPVTGLPEVVMDLDKNLVLGGVEPVEIARGIIDALTGRVALPSSDECVRYAERFDWARIAEKVAGVYREVA